SYIFTLTSYSHGEICCDSAECLYLKSSATSITMPSRRNSRNMRKRSKSNTRSPLPNASKTYISRPLIIDGLTEYSHAEYNHDQSLRSVVHYRLLHLFAAWCRASH